LLKDAVARDPEIGILVIELLPISSRITDPPLGRKAFCKAVLRILSSLDIGRFVLLSNSYGTVMAAHLHRSPDLAPRIAATIFIDPIPFLLHLPDVAFNFVYRQPREANEWLLWFFSSRDPDVSRALSRHFIWTESVLWKEELHGKSVCIFLSGSDQIVPANTVRKYLTGQDTPQLHWSKDGLDVLYQPDLDHAMVFDKRDRWDGLLAWTLFHCGTHLPLEESGEC
jgi:pimeloyl-ACP methyl ester carboxylesterase